MASTGEIRATDWQLWMCNQETGTDFLHRWGPESEMKLLLQAESDRGRDVWLIDPAREKHLPADDAVTQSLQPHQQRVVQEKAELDDKAMKLSNFIGLNPIFANIDSAEQERLKEQCEIMWQYSEILGKRIAAFTQV